MRDGWPSHRLNLIASSPAFLDRPARLAGVESVVRLSGAAVARARVALARSRGVSRQRPAAGVHGVWQPDADRRSRICRHGGDLRGRRAPSRIAARSSRPRSTRPANRPRAVRQAHAAPAGVSSMRGRRAPCGAGTTHTTLRAGVPSVAGAARVGSIRVGRRTASARRGAAAVAPTKGPRRAGVAHRETIGNPRMKQPPMAMSARMQNDNGPETAADLIERVDGVEQILI